MGGNTMATKLIFVIFYMAKCATYVFHEKDKRMENAWFSANYNEAKTMRSPCIYPNAWKTHVAQLAMYLWPTQINKIYTLDRPTQ